MSGNRDRLILIHGAARAAGTVDRVASRVGGPGAGDATLAHLPVVAYVCLGKATLWLDDDGYCHTCQGYRNKNSGQYYKFQKHQLPVITV